MKSKIFKSIIAIIIVTITAINVDYDNDNNNLLLLENIEALATEHSSLSCPGGKELCATVNSPMGTTKYYKK